MKTTFSLIESLGFSDMEVAMSKEFPVLNKILTLIPPKSYVLIGGGAVVLHVGKESRIISPDLDIMVLPEAFSKITTNFEWVRNRFGVTIQEANNIELDIILAKKNYERKAIQEAGTHTFDNQKIRVITLPYLITMKLVSGREKDEQDVILLLTKFPDAAIKARQVLKQYRPDLVDDLKSLSMYASIVK